MPNALLVRAPIGGQAEQRREMARRRGAVAPVLNVTYLHRRQGFILFARLDSSLHRMPADG